MKNRYIPCTIELKDISFTYPGQNKPLFSNLNLHLHTEKIGLVGDNGSGKTTLLQIMVGLLKPDRGDILFNGQIMKNEKDFHSLRQRVGMLFQNADDQLFCPSVLEDVAFGPLNLGRSQEEAREISYQTLQRVGLSGYEDRITHRLSGGEKRLVALATVLAMEPCVLLMDEPTNDLDHEGRRRLLDILENLEQAYIIVSHDWEFLSRLCKGFYGLKDNRLHKSDTVKVHHHQHAHPLGEQGHHHRHSS